MPRAQPRQDPDGIKQGKGSRSLGALASELLAAPASLLGTCSGSARPGNPRAARGKGKQTGIWRILPLRGSARGAKTGNVHMAHSAAGSWHWTALGMTRDTAVTGGA